MSNDINGNIPEEKMELIDSKSVPDRKVPTRQLQRSVSADSSTEVTDVINSKGSSGSYHDIISLLQDDLTVAVKVATLETMNDLAGCCDNDNSVKYM